MSTFQTLVSVFRGPLLKLSQACRLVSLEGALIVTVLTLFAIGIAHAQENQGIAVRYDDLDLTSAAGTASLRARIERAAERVCGVSAGVHNLTTQIAERRCADRAVATAMAKVQIASAALRSCHATQDHLCPVDAGSCGTSTTAPHC